MYRQELPLEGDKRRWFPIGLTIDDELFQRALEVADPGTDKADLFREAMKAFVRVQTGKRLAAPGGKAPRMKSVPRRRPL